MKKGEEGVIADVFHDRVHGSSVDCTDCKDHARNVIDALERAGYMIVIRALVEPW